MAYPVKTLVLRTIKEELAALTDSEGSLLFSTVKRNPSKPIDHDFFVSPECFIFDDKETKLRRNRISDNTLPIQIEVWFKNSDGPEDDYTQEEESSDLMDIIEAEIFKMFATNSNIKIYAKDVNPEAGSIEKFFVDDVMSVLVMRFVVKYVNEWTNPYDIGRQ